MLVAKETALTHQGKQETSENIFVNQKACDLQMKKLWESCYDSYREVKVCHQAIACTDAARGVGVEA